MCGIAGYVDFHAGSVCPDVLNAMAMSLSRRGPDALERCSDARRDGPHHARYPTTAKSCGPKK